MKKARLSKAETRVLEQFSKIGTCSVREILESLPEDERVAYTTVQTLVYRLEEKGAVRKVKKIGNAQLFEPAINQSEFRGGLVRDILDLFGGSPRLLVSNLLETGTPTLKDLKALQNAAPNSKKSRGLEPSSRPFKCCFPSTHVPRSEHDADCGVRRCCLCGRSWNRGAHSLLLCRSDLISRRPYESKD